MTDFKCNIHGARMHRLLHQTRRGNLLKTGLSCHVIQADQGNYRLRQVDGQHEIIPPAAVLLQSSNSVTAMPLSAGKRGNPA